MAMMAILYPRPEQSCKRCPLVRCVPVLFRALGSLGLAALGAVLVSCAEPAAPAAPAALRLSVHRSTLLADYANPPLWVWTVDGGGAVAAVQVSLDGEPYRRLHSSAGSWRPARPLAPGHHVLTVRVRTAGASLQASAEAQVVALPGRSPLPDDPCYLEEADPRRCGGNGSTAGQWPLRQIRLPEVWHALEADALRDPVPVVVAVLDTGYRRHPDLEPNLDVDAGYDFVSDRSTSGDGDGIDPDAADPATGGPWHGTAIAGIIAARTDNGTGVAGMGWPWGRSRVTIMPVRVVPQGGATSYDVAQGLLYAAGLANDSGALPPSPARIINLSLADSLPGPTDPVLEDALRRVTAAGAIVVSAAGNDGSAVRAPANSACTLAVASANVDGSLAATSNFGSEIDVVAPGGDHRAEIVTLGADRLGPARWGVTLDEGTSLAAAHVSGVLALVAGIGRSLTLDDARALLAESSADLGGQDRGHRFGAGLLDAFALFGAYPGSGARQVDGQVGVCFREGAKSPSVAADGARAPDGVDPHSLIVRLRAGAAPDAAAGTEGDPAHTGEYALVRLADGQDRGAARARLQADPAVAAVYDNRIYLPAVVPAE